MATRIACAGISGRILQGRVTTDGKAFAGKTVDVTSDVLAAMIDKLKHHGGSMPVTSNGKLVATITLISHEPCSCSEGCDGDHQ